MTPLRRALPTSTTRGPEKTASTVSRLSGTKRRPTPSALRPCSTTPATRPSPRKWSAPSPRPRASVSASKAAATRRDHLRSLAQRVEVANGEVRIMGSKTRLLQALTAKNGVNSAPIQGLRWRMGWDSNPRYAFTYGGFQDRCLKPLGHPSMSYPYSGRTYQARPSTILVRLA